MDLRFYPFFKVVGYGRPHYTPNVVYSGSVRNARAHPKATARDTLQAWGVTVSLKRLERLTYRFGHLGLFRRQQQVNQLRWGNLLSTSVLKDQRVQTWFKTARVSLKRGRTAQLISQMQAMLEKASGKRQQLMAGQLAYFH